MKFSVKFSAIVGLFALMMCSSQVFAQENLSFKGLKIAGGASMTSAGGTATTSGSGTYTSVVGSALTGTGTYLISSNSSFKPNGYIGRAELGYDWAVNERGIIGLSLSKDFSSSDTSASLSTTSTLDSSSCTTTCDSSYTFRDSPTVVLQGPYALALRLGYVTAKETMVYAKLAYANAKISGTFSERAHGIGVGLGFESNLSKHWFMRGEVESIFYNSFDVTTTINNDFVGSVKDTIKLSSNSARLLIGLRF
jgi:hypothetical protein